MKCAQVVDGRERLTAALPPARSTSRPHFAASGCVQDTIPSVLWMTLRREANFWNPAEGGGNRDALGRGMTD